jgi:hypothetical protein
MMKAARTSETLVNFYQTTRRYNPEDSHLRTHRRENLKSYAVNLEIQFCLAVWKQVADNTLNIRYDFITDRGRQACWVARCVGKWFYLSVLLTKPHTMEE